MEVESLSGRGIYQKETQINLITSRAESYKISTFNGANPVILFIMLFKINVFTDFQTTPLKFTFLYIVSETCRGLKVKKV